MAEILLNKESFESLNTRFEAIFSQVDEGMNYAAKAENNIGDNVMLGAMRISFEIQIESIRQIISLIINSFTNADKESKEAAEKIVGVDIYNAISAGNTVEYDGNGGYTINSSDNTSSAGVSTSTAGGGNTTSTSSAGSSDGSGGASVPSTVNDPHLEGYQGHRQNLPDNCTNSCLAMMIQRYDLVHNGNCGLVYDDIGKNDFYWSVEDFGQHLDRTLPDGRSFHTHWGDTDWFNQVGGGNTQAGMAAVLSNFPEGIVLYGRYATGGAHAILLTGCTSHGDGTYSFTAIDPASGGTMDLTETSLFRGSNGHPGSYNSVDELLNNLFYYSYIESMG